MTLSPFVNINRCFWQVIYTISYIRTEMMGVCWSDNTVESMCWGPKKNVTYVFVPDSLEAPRMSYLSYLVCKIGGW